MIYASNVFSRPAGFRFTIALSIVGTLLLSWVLAGIHGEAPSPAVAVTHDWISYILSYWQGHVGLFFCVAGVFLAAFPFGGLEQVFRAFLLEKPLEPRLLKAERRVERIAGLLATMGWAIGLMVLPVLHLAVPRYLRIAAVSAPILISALGYYRLSRGSAAPWRLTPVLRFDTKDRFNFNSAAGPPRIEEVESEIKKYDELVARNELRGPETLAFIQGRVSTLWGGLATFFNDLGSRLGVSPDRLSTYPSTTDAIARAISILGIPGSEILISDLEYPSVRTQAGVWAKKIGANYEELSIREQFLTGTINRTTLEDLWIHAICDKKKQAKDTIVIISHILFESGDTINVQEIIQKTRVAQGLGKVFFVVDGAQACGNIPVSTALLDMTDFYAGCGHKWYLARQSIGFLIAPGHQAEAKIDLSTIPDPTLPFSHCKFDLEKDYSGKTVDLRPLLSFGMTLSLFRGHSQETLTKHTCEAAQYVAQHLLGQGLRPITKMPIESGLLLLRLPDGASAPVVARLLAKRHDVGCHPVNDHYLRLSFHAFHKSSDVNVLMETIGETLLYLEESLPTYQ